MEEVPKEHEHTQQWNTGMRTEKNLTLGKRLQMMWRSSSSQLDGSSGQELRMIPLSVPRGLHWTIRILKFLMSFLKCKKMVSDGEERF